MTSYQRGEFAAFEQLYAHLGPKIRGYLAALTWNPQQAEDLTQETFLQVHRSRHLYSPPRPVSPWVFAIARHCYWMECRAFSRKRRLEVFPETELVDVPIPADVEGLAERMALRRALRELPEEGRETLLLHHIWGFSFEEIGGMLGTSAGAAKVRSHRAMQELRQSMT
jgi:RNA polymerase sigma-70 factor (ECF subfamily)